MHNVGRLKGSRDIPGIVRVGVKGQRPSVPS